MKIYIPFTFQDIGGPSSFVAKFKAGLEKKGHVVTFEETTDYDILFVIVQAPFGILLRAKKMSKPIIQRLDGVYYWSVSGWMFPFLNLKAALTRHLFATYSIYQSWYSKFCVEKFLGKKKHDLYEIIYNGVDTELFSNAGPETILRENSEQSIFFSASAFRRKDQIIPLIEALRVYHDTYNSNFKLVLGGTFTREVANILPFLSTIPWIQVLGKIPNTHLPSYERSSDIFVFTHLNPPCPNNIIEALACGLPICGVGDGAMPELVKNNQTGLLLPIASNGFWTKRTFDKNLFVKNLDTLMKNRNSYSQKSREAAVELFSLERMIDQYEKVFIQVTQ